MAEGVESFREAHDLTKAGAVRRLIAQSIRDQTTPEKMQRRLNLVTSIVFATLLYVTSALTYDPATATAGLGAGLLAGAGGVLADRRWNR